MPDLPAGATATVVLSGAYPLGSLSGDTVAAVDGIRIADPARENNVTTLRVEDAPTPPTTVTVP